MAIDVRQVAPEGRQLIQGYGGGGFTVSGVRQEGSILIRVERTLPWPVADFAAITLPSLAPLMDGTLDIILVGTGARFAILPPDLRRALAAAKVQVEVMATPAACRTYNILLAEDRLVGAALLVAS